jgi:hypothetical protein
VHSLITSMNTAPIVASVDVRSDSQVCCATYLNESTAAIDWNSVLDLLTMMSQRTLPRWW